MRSPSAGPAECQQSIHVAKLGTACAVKIHGVYDTKERHGVPLALSHRRRSSDLLGCPACVRCPSQISR
jgi:hypothetical protein